MVLYFNLLIKDVQQNNKKQWIKKNHYDILLSINNKIRNENMTNKVFEVAGTVLTQRGSTDVEGKREEFVNTYPEAKTEEEARDAWKEEVSSDKLNMDWSVTGVREIDES